MEESFFVESCTTFSMLRNFQNVFSRFSIYTVELKFLRNHKFASFHQNCNRKLQTCTGKFYRNKFYQMVQIFDSPKNPKLAFNIDYHHHMQTHLPR